MEDGKENLVEDMCVVCLSHFQVGEIVRELPDCSHFFHTECISPWLTERSNCCPVCKTPVDSASLYSPTEERSSSSSSSSSFPRPSTEPFYDEEEENSSRDSWWGHSSSSNSESKDGEVTSPLPFRQLEEPLLDPIRDISPSSSHSEDWSSWISSYIFNPTQTTSRNLSNEEQNTQIQSQSDDQLTNI